MDRLVFCCLGPKRLIKEKKERRSEGKLLVCVFRSFFINFPSRRVPALSWREGSVRSACAWSGRLLPQGPFPASLKTRRGDLRLRSARLRRMRAAHGQEAPIIFFCASLLLPRRVLLRGGRFRRQSSLAASLKDAEGRAAAGRRSFRWACARARPRAVFFFVLCFLVFVAPCFRRQSSLAASLKTRRGELRLGGARSVGCVPGRGHGLSVVLFVVPCFGCAVCCVRLGTVVSGGRTPWPRPYARRSLPGVRAGARPCVVVGVCVSWLLWQGV